MLPEHDTVCYEYLRPEEVKRLRDSCPVAYLVAGSIEWHGFQNPLGTDTLKAHAICCEAALRYGGVVLPPIYFGFMCKDGTHLKNWGPEGWTGYTLGFTELSTLEAGIYGMAKALVVAGWRVIVGVTGHDIAPQRDAMQRAIGNATQNTGAAGFALMEGELHTPDEDIPLRMDHAASWETSCMMHAYPERVDLETLRCRGLKPDSPIHIDDAYGMAGKNPLASASADMGRKIIEKMGGLIGAKARALLETLE